MLISLIALSGGELSDHKLKRSLARLNCGTNMPMDRTDNVLVKLVRQGYLERVVDKADGNQEEDTVTWCIGQRGRVEVPPQSIANFVAEVYGADKPEEFDKKLHKSLGLQQPDDVDMQDIA
jgi:melanoma-associated antigen